jgi:phospholipid/cholesterol/gamma-HCH transport system substrate-binding protein
VGGVFLFLTFGQFRSGSTAPYSAVFTDVSQLKSGDSVRVAGIRVGTVDDVRLGDDKKVSVRFSADRDVVLTTGTRAQVRYMNLVGDRYLELVDGPGSTRVLPPGSQISEDRTAPALDLDLLLTGLKPVIKGLNPKDINTLSASLLDVLQGRGDTLQSLLSKTSSFSNALADKGQVIEQVIDSLDSLLGTLAKDGDKFSGAIDRLERLLTQLSADREPIGDAIESLNNGTASLADLLTQARPPLAGTVSQLNRLAPLLDQDKDRIDSAIQKLPANYRKLIRPGAYGSFINYYICGLTIRVTDLQGRTAIFPWVKQETGRCAES